MASTEEASSGPEGPPPDEERCQALTGDGERCTRRATDGPFCYQHDEDDPTVDDASAEGSDADESENSSDSSDSGEPGDTNDSGDSDDSMNEDNSTDESDSAASDNGSESSAEESASSVMAVRGAVVEVAGDLIGRPLDGVVEVGKTEDGWRAVVEVVERRAVPDTQDILGRYELMLDSPDDVTGYRRTGRYRRADTGSDEF